MLDFYFWVVSLANERFKSDNIQSKDIRGAVDKYLGVGDWMLDQSIAFMSSSAYFERKR